MQVVYMMFLLELLQLNTRIPLKDAIHSTYSYTSIHIDISII